MILKKKEIRYEILKKIRYLFSKLFLLLGVISFLFFLIVTTYYFSSGLSKRFPPVQFIKNVDRVILERYIGFSFFKIDDYFKIKIYNIKHLFIKNKLENIVINIDQKNLYNLELQRQQRLGKIPRSETDLYNYSFGEIIYQGEKFPIKLRVKGDRMIHFQDKDNTSYKVDLRGTKRIWGLEEFALQKPITRNYVYEHMFHKLLEINNLISLKYLFINLRLNDSDQGIYAVEEGFSKELIERNKRRNGPIFGIDEVVSDVITVVYPNVLFDLYSKNYWLENYPELIENALSKLNNLKKKNVNVEDVFDLEKWATYFAIIDLSNGIHGAISKSVKLYYNVVTSKFEPIGFDAQIDPEYYTDFLLLDFLNPKNNNCGPYCHDREWFLRFLKTNDGKLNNEFVNLYLKKLKKISSNEFLNDFNNKYSKKINFFNSQIYSENSKKTRGLYKGLGLYIFDKDFLNKRSNYIKSRLDRIDKKEKIQLSLKDEKIIFDNLNKPFFKRLNINCKNEENKKDFIYDDIEINFDPNCKYLIGDQNIKPHRNIFILNNNDTKIENELSDLNEIEQINNIYYLKKNILINKDYYFPQNKKLIIQEGVKINFESDASIISEGSVIFQGSKKKPIIIDGGNGKGSFILSNNEFNFNNVIIQNLSFPKDKRKILYGGINVINSKLKIENTEIKNSNSEDAINVISSESFIKNLIVKNIKADAIDIDFGILSFENISCEDISNDCLDASGAQIKGSFLIGNKIEDKGLSFGENSEGEISHINFQNAKLGIAVKDGSYLKLSKYKFNNNQYDLAVFNKKQEYKGSTLLMNNPEEKNTLKVLIGFKNNIIKDNVELTEKIDNEKINMLFY